MLNLQASSTQDFFSDLPTLLLQETSRDLLNKLIGMEHLDVFIQNLQPTDFFWIVKRIGEEDSLPLLAVATKDQWQYMLDLETWHKDQINYEEVIFWIDRLNRANASKFAEWIYSEQKDLIALTILHKAEILFKEEEGEWEVPPGYFTLDGSFYVKAFNEKDTPILENFLRTIAHENFEAYRALLLNIPSYISTETEEELYRQRTNRLAEYGFASFDESLAIYSPLDPSVLSFETKPLLPGALIVQEEKSLVPSLAFHCIKDFRLLVNAFNQISDPLEADRIRLEFTTICNTLIAADSFACINNFENLRQIGKQAAGYIHVTLGKLCDKDIGKAANLLQDHSLMTIFRVGFGFTIKLQWRVKNFISQGWFSKMGKSLDFWGSQWADKIKGLLFKRPLFFDCHAKAEPYRHFERIEDLQEIESLLDKLDVLDRMLGRMTEVESSQAIVFHRVFHTLLFNRWANYMLHLSPSFAPLSLAQAKKFFQLLRQNEKSRPYKMGQYKDTFIGEFLKGSDGFDAKAKSCLRETLNEIWNEFCREYENIEVKDLDAHYSKYLLIEDK